jgi:transposase
MAKARTLVGLDVHAARIVAAVLDVETGELQWFRLGGDVAEAAALCAGLPRPVRATYEAGPTGYGLARELVRRGVQCVVAAPNKIPLASGDRVKTDRRDAEHLVRLLLAGRLHPVRVPGPEEEALRDLVRAREAVRQDLMRCRHRLSKLLLRHGVRFDDGPTWHGRHRAWLAASSCASRRRRRRWPTRSARSTPSCTAAMRSSARSSRSCPIARGGSRPRGFAACAGSTRSPRSVRAPRSATLSASRAPSS